MFILCSEYINKYSLLRIYVRIKENIRNTMAMFISQENYIAISEEEASELNVDLNTNIGEVIEEYYTNLLNLVFIGISLIFYSVVIFEMDKGMVLFVILPNVITLFIPKLLKKNIARKKEDMIGASESYNFMFFDFYRGSNILKNLSAITIWRKRLGENSKKALEKETVYCMEQNWGEILLGSISYMGVFGMVAYGVFAILNGHMTIGTLVASIQYSDMISVPIINFSVGLNELSAGKLIKKRFEERYKEITIAKEQQRKRFENLEINDLKFSYTSDKVLFSVLDFRINKGDKVLLKGKNGTGKSSFLKVLLRALPEYEGEIRINECDIRNYSFTEMSNFIGYVPQCDYLFSGTVNENIQNFKEKNSEINEKEILDITEITKLVTKNLEVKKLSGGERQRVCLARTLLHGKDILFIDEGLNEVEQELRIKILKWLLEKDNLTFIYISHDKNDYLSAFDKKIEFK